MREATNSDKWGPTGQQMKEISVSGALGARSVGPWVFWGCSVSKKHEKKDLSNSQEHFNIVMNTIWKRLNDNGKYWRHVYKSLLLLDYMLKARHLYCGHCCLSDSFLTG